MSNNLKSTIKLMMFAAIVFIITTYTSASAEPTQPLPMPVKSAPDVVKTKIYNTNNKISISEKDMNTYKKYLNSGIKEFLNKKVLLIMYTKGIDELKDYNFDKAITNFEKAININPDGTEALAYRADLYRIKGDDKNAIKFAQKAMSINPTDAYANFIMGSLYSSSDTEKALNYLNTAIHYNSNFERAYVNRANIYYKDGLYKNSLDDYSKVVKINPINYFAYEGRALSNFSLKQLSSALSDFNFLVKKQPKNMRYLMMRALCHSELNNFPQALADINKVINIEPNNMDAYLVRLQIYQVFKADKNLITSDVSKVLNLAGNNEDKLLKLMEECSALGLDNQVIRIADKILSINPNNAEVYYKIAKSLLVQKKYQSAYDYFTKYKEKTEEINPEFDYYIGIAKLGIANRNNKILIKEAISDLTNSINKNIHTEESYLYRGSAKVIIGEYVDGYNDLKKYTTLVSVPCKLAYHQMGFAETMNRFNGIKYNKNGYAESIPNKYLGSCNEFEMLSQTYDNDTSAKINQIVHSSDISIIKSAFSQILNNSSNVAYFRTLQIKFSPTDIETGIITSPYINALGDGSSENLSIQSKNTILAELLKERICTNLLNSEDKLDVSAYEIEEFFDTIKNNVSKSDAISILCHLFNSVLSKGSQIDEVELKDYPKNMFLNSIEYIENKNCAYDSGTTKYIMRKSNEFLGCMELGEDNIDNVKNYFYAAINYGASKKKLYEFIALWYLEKGDSEYDSGNTESAIYYYNQATYYDYSKYEVYKHIGDIYSSHNKWFDASTYYTKALNVKKSAEAYYSRAYAYSKMNDNSAAIADYTKCLGLNKNYSDAYWNRASIYFNRRKWTLAYSDYSKYSALNKDEPSAVYNMAVCMLNQGNKKAAYPLFSKAKGMYQRTRNSNGYNNCVRNMNRINGYYY